MLERKGRGKPSRSEFVSHVVKDNMNVPNWLGVKSAKRVFYRSEIWRNADSTDSRCAENEHPWIGGLCNYGPT